MRGMMTKSNLTKSVGTEASNCKLDFSANRNMPVCPKPRRPIPSIPDVIKPLRCNKHRYSYQPNCDGRSGFLNMSDDKTSSDGQEFTCTGCSPSCYSGSPPGRTDNPLVHDVQFLHQMELLSPLSVRTKLSDKFGFNSPASPI